MEFTFPAIAQEDRSAKLKDIAFTEAMDYFTKERACGNGGARVQDHRLPLRGGGEASARSAGEDPVIAQGLQQMPKIAQRTRAGSSRGSAAT